MFFRLLIGLLFLITENVAATQFPLEIIDYLDDTKIVIFINEADIDEAPTWNPSAGAPPLTIEHLVKDVQKWGAANPNLTHAIIHKIELKPILHHEKQNRWYYLIQMKVQVDDHSDMHYLAVLMNGKILSAMKEPTSYK